MTNLETQTDRYDRQQLIEGWDQEKLNNARIAIVGVDAMANCVLLSAAALGFGNIEVYGQGFVTEDILKQYRRTKTQPDYSEGFLYFEAQSGESKAHALAQMARKFNPLVDVRGINLDLYTGQNLNIIGKPDIIFEATQDPVSKLAVLEYAKRNHVAVASFSASDSTGKYGFFNPRKRTQLVNHLENILFEEMKYLDQDSTLSQVMASLGVDDARKYLMPIGQEKPVEDIVLINLYAKNRLDDLADFTPEGEPGLGGKVVLQVGAGALGNFTGLELILNNVGKLIVIDDDIVEPTNLNRQVWFYDAVGQPKAKALIAKFRKINPRTSYEAIIKRVNPDFEDYFKTNHVDLIIETVDNDKTRALLNYFSMKYKIPLVSAGTRYSSGHVNSVVPGENACLDCQTDIDRYALEAHKPASCILAAQPSVITSNQITGGLAVTEARKILNPEHYGKYVNAQLKYISDEDLRLGLFPHQKNKCGCTDDKEKKRTWLEKMKHLFGGK